MKLFSFFAKMFSSKKPVELPVTIAEEYMPVVEEQPVVIVPEEEVLQPKKKKVVKAKPRNNSL
jgi:hypothetical protein